MKWSPAPGESEHYRTPITFATGTAPLVEGKRWFRDTGRRDIQRELPGWPQGPDFDSNSAGERAANVATGGILGAIPVVLNILSSLGGGPPAPYGRGGGPAPKDAADEPENEVEDFPVMWAAPGTTARTLPWQLDPSRCPQRRLTPYQTTAVLTDRRLLFIGAWPKDSEPPSVLWELPRRDLAGAELMEFSHARADFRLAFTDGSWVRLSTHDNARSRRLVNLLSGASRILRATELTPGQRQRVTDYAAALPWEARTVLTLLPSGAVHAEFFDVKDGGSVAIRMGADGQSVPPQPGDL